MRSLRAFHALFVVYGLTLAVGLVTRLALLAHDAAWGGTRAIGEALVVGALYDALVATYFALPLALWLGLAPRRLWRSRAHAYLLAAGLAIFAFIVLLVAVAEWVFWDEFGARFNFIAVDYLIYTREVLGNILESFPVGRIVAALMALALLFGAWTLRRLRPLAAAPRPWQARAAVPALVAMLCAGLTLAVSADSKPRFERDAARELAGNGIYQFFSALRHSSLDYDAFYATLPADRARAILRPMLSAAGELWPASASTEFERLVIDRSPERRLNVVLVSVESLGAEFVGYHGDARHLTPNLDRLAAQSLVFTDVFATGNRTVRGLEALSLSIPPTPGEAIVKRPGAEDLFTLGSVFEDRGYESLFIYGGYGYFDNMQAFFSTNDYRVVDRRAIPAQRIHHETVWGVADEDLFDQALVELDRAHAQGKPFFAHVMTTSNHRPYTYPEGRIDIPPGSGREGAVKYTDYALGRFLDEAAKHAWFRDTLFVITADHGANARGTLEIPVEHYRIPLLFYSPGNVRPGRVDRLMSQIDIAPTLLGRLHLSYRTKFFGRDIFTTSPGEERAFVANYQTLGYLRAGRLVTLAPHRSVHVTPYVTPDSRIDDRRVIEEAIAWYQVAFDAYGAGDFDDDESNKQPPTRALEAKGPVVIAKPVTKHHHTPL